MTTNQEEYMFTPYKLPNNTRKWNHIKSDNKRKDFDAI